jgi:hypothetical protein
MKKSDLETEILELILRYEKTTGNRVTDIDFITISGVDGISQIIDVDITVEVAK